MPTTVRIDLDRHRFTCSVRRKTGSGPPPVNRYDQARGTAATRICGCHFVDSTRSPYSATNSLVDWVR
jgi:hypothetical protein